MTTPTECPHEYPFDGNTILAVCRLCGFRYVSNNIHGDALTLVADLLEFVATVEEDPKTAKESRELAASMRHRARHEARWGWAWKLLAPLGHPAALWVMLVGFWAWWLLDPGTWLGNALITWLFRAVWSGWTLTMIVLRTQQTRRHRRLRRGKIRRKG